MIIKADTDKNDARFVVVTEAVDKNGAPIIAAVKPYGRAYYFNLDMPSNFMLSGYGKNGIVNFIRTAKNENRILYVQKNSQTFKNIPGVQFADNIFASDYSHNLAEFQKIVKEKFAGTIFENSGLPKFSDRESASDVRRQWDEEAKAMEQSHRYDLKAQKAELDAKYKAEIADIRQQWDAEIEAVRASDSYDKDEALKAMKRKYESQIKDIQTQWDREAKAMERSFQYDLKEQRKQLVQEYKQKLPMGLN